MTTISIKQFAEIYGLTERTVRNYCAQGRIAGAFITGKTWILPADAVPPRRNRHKSSPLLTALKQQKESRLPGGIYHRVQVSLTYNSNHIEGSKLTEDETRMIFETHTIASPEGNVLRVDDIVETVNHFRCIDYVIDHAQDVLTEGLIKQLHRLLKTGTAVSERDWFAVGEYKRLANEVVGMDTSSPDEVADDMAVLLRDYQSLKCVSIEDIISFHYRFEAIHPFQDGNGRVGRLIMFKECLAHNIVPFIIDENLRFFYYRGLREYPHIKGYLVDTCLTAQDMFKEVLNRLKIKY